MEKQGMCASAMMRAKRCLWWVYSKAYTAQGKEVQDPRGLMHFIWMIGVGMRFWLVHQISWVYLLGVVVGCLVIVKGVEIYLLASSNMYVSFTGLVIVYIDMLLMLVALLAFVGQCYRFGEWLNAFLTRHIAWVYFFVGALAIVSIGHSLHQGMFLQEIYQSFQSFSAHTSMLLTGIAFASIFAFKWAMMIALPGCITGYMIVWFYQKLPDSRKQFFRNSLCFMASLAQKTTVKIHPPRDVK